MPPRSSPAWTSNARRWSGLLGQEVPPAGLGRVPPGRVVLVEQLGGPGTAPLGRQQLTRQLRIEEREAPPLVHQPGLRQQRRLRRPGVQAAELVDEAQTRLVHE